MGSFLNVVALYWPAHMKQQWNRDVAEYLERTPESLGLDVQAPPGLLTRRSACPACGARLRWWQLIPLLGFVLLRGRCHACQTSISWRYPAVELLTAVLFAGLAMRQGPSSLALALAIVLCALVVMTLIDLDHLLLPDDMTLPLLWAGLLWHGIMPGLPLRDTVFGAIAGYLSLWTVYQAFRLSTGREGMGHGDFKLLAALGAWLGWQALLPIVLVASVCGSVWGISLILLKRAQRQQAIPFGPWLALAGALEILQINPVHLLWKILLPA